MLSEVDQHIDQIPKTGQGESALPRFLIYGCNGGNECRRGRQIAAPTPCDAGAVVPVGAGRWWSEVSEYNPPALCATPFQKGA